MANNFSLQDLEFLSDEDKVKKDYNDSIDKKAQFGIDTRSNLDRRQTPERRRTIRFEKSRRSNKRRRATDKASGWDSGIL